MPVQDSIFSVTERPGAIDLVELADAGAGAGSLALVAPSRGAIATRFVVGGRELFFLDEATLADRSANVRGGNPLLFPSPGKLTGDRFERAGRSGSMKQHGFGRTLPWDVLRTSTAGAASVTLGLGSSAATRAAYPWDFRAELSYSLRGAVLRAGLDVTNLSDAQMPFAAGFHPYFLVPQADKAHAQIASGATRAFDNVQKQMIAFHGFDLTASEVDVHLLDHGRDEAVLTTPAGLVRVRGSAEITTWVVWTLRGRDFVCLEPWTATGDALNTGERLLTVEPRETRSLWIEIAAE